MVRLLHAQRWAIARPTRTAVGIARAILRRSRPDHPRCAQTAHLPADLARPARAILPKRWANAHPTPGRAAAIACSTLPLPADLACRLRTTLPKRLAITHPTRTATGNSPPILPRSIRPDHRRPTATAQLLEGLARPLRPTPPKPRAHAHPPASPAPGAVPASPHSSSANILGRVREGRRPSRGLLLAV